VLRRRRVTKSIASDTNGPNDAITIGITRRGRRIVQTDAEAAGHTLVAGATGSGKTRAMFMGIRDAIRRGEAVLFMDLKGSTDVPAQLAEWSARYGRKFLHWTIQDPRAPYLGPAEGPAFYDPIGRGDPSRRKDLLIGSQKWDVEYYKSVVANYLQIAFQVSDLTAVPGIDSFTEIAELLDFNKLIQRARTLMDASQLDGDGIMRLQEGAAWQDLIPHLVDPRLRSLMEAVAQSVSGLDKAEGGQELSGIRNMRARLQTLTQSTAGAWLRKSPTGERNIDLRRLVDEGWVVVISLDSSQYEETAKQIGGLMIQDLKTLSSELRHAPAPGPLHVYIDEFSAIGSDNVLGLLARARDARMPVTLSTQALADLTRADPSFPDQVIAIIGSFFILRANAEDDATIFAGLTGKHTVFKRQLGVEMTSGFPGGVGTGAATGTGMIREEEDYRVLPQEFQALTPGHLIYIAKTPTIRVEKDVTVILEDEVAAAAAGPHVGAPTQAPREPEPQPLRQVTDLPDGSDARTPAPRPQATVTVPAPRAPRGPILPDTDLSAVHARPVAPAPAPVPAPPYEAGSEVTPAPVAAPKSPIIDPAAFRRPGGAGGPAPSRPLPLPPVASTRAALPVPPVRLPLPVAPPIRPLGGVSLPTNRPMPVTVHTAARDQAPVEAPVEAPVAPAQPTASAKEHGEALVLPITAQPSSDSPAATALTQASRPGAKMFDETDWNKA
jgi:hypothetical protein